MPTNLRDKMEKFLERHKLPKLTQYNRQNLNRLITSKNTSLVILKLPTKESPGPDGFTGELYI